MSDYEEDDDNLSYEGYESINEKEIDDEDDFLGNEANGHGFKGDEEDEAEERAEEENYGDIEPTEGQDDGIKPEEEEEEEEIEQVEEKVDTKIVPMNKRKTSKLMTKFEYSYLISQRAMAIEHGSPLMIQNTEFIHSLDIAREETHKGVNPIIIQRELPNGLIEEWKCSELIVPFAYTSDLNFIENFKY